MEKYRVLRDDEIMTLIIALESVIAASKILRKELGNTDDIDANIREYRRLKNNLKRTRDKIYCLDQDELHILNKDDLPLQEDMFN